MGVPVCLNTTNTTTSEWERHLYRTSKGLFVELRDMSSLCDHPFEPYRDLCIDVSLYSDSIVLTLHCVLRCVQAIIPAKLVLIILKRSVSKTRFFSSLISSLPAYQLIVHVIHSELTLANIILSLPEPQLASAAAVNHQRHVRPSRG